MKLLFCPIWLSLLGLLAAGAQEPGVPPGTKGVYYRKSGAEWIMLDPATLSDSESRGLDRFIATEGMSGLNVNLTFDGSNSPVQIEDRRPVFYVRGIVPGDDALIVQMAVKRDSREVQTSLSLAGVNNKEGFRNANIRRVSTRPADEEALFIVTPQETLKPGEYLLVFGHIDTAFNFGIPR